MNTFKTNFLFKYLQTILLISGLAIFDLGIFLQFNTAFGLIATGAILSGLAFIFNSEKNGGSK